MDIKETDILNGDPAQHWYYRSKAEAMVKFLGDTQPSLILDVGAGSGFFSRHLLLNSSRYTQLCPTRAPAEIIVDLQ
ncbi:hypothetical protein MXC99_01765 [Thauera aromatica]|uniref:hypothetical protein n=1 Tax=Thauera aromatica TaxID=59405 RepID=UPI001FFD5B68|nr:hypothetical protein [Thauera aromatica]MCK2086918.1 hypothetical protein [Thauera aromatica]